MGGNKKWWLIGAVVVLAAAFWFVFLRGDTPDAVDIGAANEQLDADLAAEAGTDDGADDAAATGDDAVGETDGDTEAIDDEAPAEDATQDEFDGDVDGEWIVDDEIGSFDFETASGSFAGFRVDEELTVGAVVAVGRTGGVTGSLTIDGGALVAAEINVDMTTIVSNDSRREGAIRGAVGASSSVVAALQSSSMSPLHSSSAPGLMAASASLQSPVSSTYCGTGEQLSRGANGEPKPSPSASR